MPRIRSTTILIAALCALKLPAQTVPANTPGNDASAGETIILSPFVVSSQSDIGYRATNTTSATKTDTPIQEVPQSIQVINQEFILDQGALSLDDTMRFTSGINEGTDIRGDRYTMRGFQTGIPSKDAFRDTGRAPREMANIERVEVIKGPAAFTFGRTNPGGMINMVLKRPRLERSSTITAVVGSNSFYRATLDTTGPIDEGKRFAYRLIGAWEDSETFRDHFFVEREFISPSMLWTISNKTSLRVEVEYLHDNRMPNRGLVMLNNQVPASVSRSTNYQWAGSRIESTQYNYLVEFLHQFNRNLSFRVASRYNNTDEFGYVTNINALNATTGMLTRNVQRSNDVVIDNRYSQIEFLLNGKALGMDHNILAGTEIGWNDADQVVDQAPLAATSIFAPDSTIAPGVFANTQNIRTYTSYRSLYLQDQIYLFDRKFAVLLGARRDDFTQEATNRRVTPLNTVELSGHFTDPRIGVAWMPSSKLTVYGLYTTSNVQPTAANPDGQILQPSVGKIFETGVKGSFLEERLTSTLAVYQLDQENVNVADPLRPGYQINVGSRRVKGVEVDGTYIIANHWTLLASAAYSTGEVTFDTVIPVGTPLANKPDWQGSLWTRYDFKTGRLKNFTVGVGWIYNDSTYIGNTGGVTLPSFTRWDALIRYRGKRLDVSINLRNLADKDYFQSAASTLDVKPGTPFTIQSSFRLRF